MSDIDSVITTSSNEILRILESYLKDEKLHSYQYLNSFVYDTIRSFDEIKNNVSVVDGSFESKKNFIRFRMALLFCRIAEYIIFKNTSREEFLFNIDTTEYILKVNFKKGSDPYSLVNFEKCLKAIIKLYKP